MTKATRVHSTPPTNTPIDSKRRRFLAVAAGASIISVGALTVAAMPVTAPYSPACTVDPIYAAIERHKETAAIWDAAVNVRAHFPDTADPRTDEQRERVDDLDNAVDEAWEPCEQASVDLINTAPTTLEGIIAAIAYIRIQMRDDGDYMVHSLLLDTGGDAQETMGWIDAFLDTIADAATDLDRAWKAVQA